MKAEAQLARRIDERLEDARSPMREHVVVIRRQRAAREQQIRYSGARSDTHRLGVDARPHRVQGAQPLEQRAVGHIASRRPLIHVVVSVDEAGHGEAVGLVDHLVGGRRRTRSDLGDHPVAREHPAVIDLLAAREQQPRLEEKGQRVRSCGRTGTRLMSRPVAARIAATIAGPDEIVGGSPTPFSP